MKNRIYYLAISLLLSIPLRLNAMEQDTGEKEYNTAEIELEEDPQEQRSRIKTRDAARFTCHVSKKIAKYVTIGVLLSPLLLLYAAGEFCENVSSNGSVIKNPPGT